MLRFTNPHNIRQRLLACPCALDRVDVGTERLSNLPNANQLAKSGTQIQGPCNLGQSCAARHNTKSARSRSLPSSQTYRTHSICSVLMIKEEPGPSVAPASCMTNNSTLFSSYGGEGPFWASCPLRPESSEQDSVDCLLF